MLTHRLVPPYILKTRRSAAAAKSGVKMERSAMVPLLGPEFDDFLFAPVSEEKNGMLLTVVSALARLDMDPWQETANLARLPRQTAIERLSGFILALPGQPSEQLDTSSIAAGLIARLPHHPFSNTVLPKGSSGLDALTPMQSQILLYVVLGMILVLGSMGFSRSQKRASNNDKASASTASGAVPTPTSTTTSPSPTVGP
jgi:hypothetical protein